MRKILAIPIFTLSSLATTVGIAYACPSGTVSCYICQDSGCTRAVKGCCLPGGG